MSMKMKIVAVPPSKIQNKAISRYELQRYFQADSAESLITTLQHGKNMGLFDFDVIVSTKYLDWVETRRTLLTPAGLGTDLGYAKPAPYELHSLSSKIKNSKPLSDIEVQRVITDAPRDILEQYLLFRLHDIDFQELRKSVTLNTNRTDKDEDYDQLKYNGLVAKGARIAYLDKPIHLGFQHRQVVRAFLKHPDTLLAPDIFTDDPDIFSPDKDYADVRETLGKLIPAVHTKLQKVIGKQCIFNEPNEGWRLKIE